MTKISFVTIIKDRTRIKINHAGKDIELRLFENNLRSLINIITPSDIWEYVIVDFESSDVNMIEFIDSLPKKDNLKFSIFTLRQRFDKGEGLNYASTLVTNDVVFFLDADMMIKSRKLFEDIETYVISQKKVLFPICWSYKDPEHKNGWKRVTGAGNVIQYKNTIVPYKKNEVWGMEDTLNFRYFDARKLAVRTYYGDAFIHQWHPANLKHKHYGKKPNVSDANLICLREECKYEKHVNKENNGGTHCCLLCKINGKHGPLCISNTGKLLKKTEKNIMRW